MTVKTFRVNSYRSFVLPPKPPIEVAVFHGPLVPSVRRASNLKRYLSAAEPENDHRIQKVVRSLD